MENKNEEYIYCLVVDEYGQTLDDFGLKPRAEAIVWLLQSHHTRYCDQDTQARSVFAVPVEGRLNKLRVIK